MCIQLTYPLLYLHIYNPSVFNLYSGCQKSNLMSFENHEYIINRTKRQYLVSNKDFIEKLMVKVYTSIYKILEILIYIWRIKNKGYELRQLFFDKLFLKEQRGGARPPEPFIALWLAW